jgi:hypothetical protein
MSAPEQARETGNRDARQRDRSICCLCPELLESPPAADAARAIQRLDDLMAAGFAVTLVAHPACIPLVTAQLGRRLPEIIPLSVRWPRLHIGLRLMHRQFDAVLLTGPHPRGESIAQMLERLRACRRRIETDLPTFIRRELDPLWMPVPADDAPAIALVQDRIGAYDVWLTDAGANCAPLRNWLDCLPQHLSSGEVLAKGRHTVRRVAGPAPDGSVADYAVKTFGHQNRLQDWSARRRGSKARRSFLNALHLYAHGVGTPAPIACLECWKDGHLAESHYISRYEAGLSSFREELIQLYRHEPDCEKLMALLETVAVAVRRLHQAGMAHRDLGNQNIALRRKGPMEWGDVQFIDLNRARLGTAGGLRARAFDLSRITLPSDYLRVFMAMYGQPHLLPEALYRHERRYRKRFALHTRTRAWRHPLRMHRLRQQAPDPASEYPDVKSIWIWDERSGQAISVVQRAERKRLYDRRNVLYIAGTVLRALPAVRRAYPAHCAAAFAQPVSLSGGTGMTVHPRPDTWAQERDLLHALLPAAHRARLPLLLRFYHHETEAEWAFTMDCLNQVQADGYPVSIALVQDRRAVTDPSRWDAFVQRVLDECVDRVEWVEIGHAINRIKWGVWNLAEYARLCKPCAAYQGRTRWMGPAVIDFEYQYLVAALARVREVIRFDALSHHLYVDRRGAPENRQGRFATVEKCALARAIADSSPACASRLIVSEVNWPLTGTGVYSPVGSPYTVPGPRTGDPSVDEEAYGHYMIRYLIQTLASGLVERVYWWRLVAHGFGLVDDRAADGWRPRPAFAMLQTWLALSHDSDFRCKLDTPAGIHAYEFEQRGGRRWICAYAHPDPAPFTFPDEAGQILDACGRELRAGHAPMHLTSAPVYRLAPPNLWSAPSFF